MKILLLAVSLVSLVLPLAGNAALHVVVIEGLAGEQRYAKQFAEQIDAVLDAARSVTDESRIRLFPADRATRDDVLDYFRELESSVSASDQVALYLIGHGSFDEHEYKFNIPGPDLSGADITSMLDRLPSNAQLLVNTSSASGAIAELAKSDKRMLILATRSGAERHATRFGSYFAAALNDATADLDKNRIITAAEAFSFAERQVGDFFERNGQLATEHARLVGDRAERFGLARLGEQRETSDDRVLGELIAERDGLNAAIEALRLEQQNLPPGEYRSQLLQNMLELAQTEEAIEERRRELGLEQ
ncbi:MAG: hypothetical protein R3192_09820 [Woeseiaceae bacterium]|nr:hypothetical protein [Woeseiaceae bacterium]